MLYKDIKYYHTRLENAVIINGVLIKEVYIDPYYEKHNEEYLEAKSEQGIKLSPAELAKRLITNEWIVEFVQKLDKKELKFGKRYDNWVYYPYEPLWKYGLSYCLIICLEDNKNYIEIVDCYRESKYERQKWRNKNYKYMNKFQKVTKSHPPQEVINKIRAELSAPDFPNKNIGLGENPTAEEKFKYEICQSIARYKRVNKLSSQEVVVRIEVSQDQLNDILYGRISHFSLNELVNYLEKLHVPFQISINNEEKASKSA